MDKYDRQLLTLVVKDLKQLSERYPAKDLLADALDSLERVVADEEVKDARH